jgi:hypothetical protein
MLDDQAYLILKKELTMSNTEQNRAEQSRAEQSLVGNSLSRCIRDILSGEVNKEQVKKIITGTRAPTRENFETIANGYDKTSWSDNGKGKTLALEFYNADKIKQPLLEGPVSWHNVGGNWVTPDREDEIFTRTPTG